jgi:F0F1-type ATP synthase delta subunit
LKSKGLRCAFRAGAKLADLTSRAPHVAGEHTTVSGMAGRYARALFELALDAKSVDAVKTDLDNFDRLISESSDLYRLVRSPVFGAEEQRRALAAILAKAGIGGLKVKLGSRMVDSSLRTKLNAIKHAMKEAG